MDSKHQKSYVKAKNSTHENTVSESLYEKCESVSKLCNWKVIESHTFCNVYEYSYRENKQILQDWEKKKQNC